MYRVRMVSMILASVVGLGLVDAQAVKEKEPDKAPAAKPPVVKLTGQLPPYFKSLGLRDDQRQAVLKIRAASKAKQEELKAAIEKAKTDEREAIAAVLTEEQRKRLKELKSGEKALK